MCQKDFGARLFYADMEMEKHGVPERQIKNGSDGGGAMLGFEFTAG
jgi:hypothetical protein